MTEDILLRQIRIEGQHLKDTITRFEARGADTSDLAGRLDMLMVSHQQRSDEVFAAQQRGTYDVNEVPF